MLNGPEAAAGFLGNAKARNDQQRRPLSSSMIRIVELIVIEVRHGETDAVLRMLERLKRLIQTVRSKIDSQGTLHALMLSHFTLLRDHAELQLAYAITLADAGDQVTERELRELRTEYDQAQQTLEAFTLASIAELDPDQR